MSLDRKIKQICRHAQSAAEFSGIVIYEHSVWEDREYNGYIFSWMIGRGELLINLKREAVHVGFALTYDDICYRYQEATVEYFKDVFNNELDKYKHAKPEEHIENILSTDDDNSGLTPLTAEDLFGNIGHGEEDEKT